MALDRQHTVVCEACGTIHEPATELLARKEQALNDVELELRNKRRQVSRLVADRDRARMQSPHYDDAERVFDYWKQKLAPKAKEFTGDRLSSVLARLEAGYTKEDIYKAIDGVAKLPYVNDKGRSPRGTRRERQADLELICRTENHLTRFMGYVEDEADASDLLPASRVLQLQSRLEAPAILKRLNELRGWEAHAMLELGLGLDGYYVVFFARDAEGRLTGFSRYQPNPARRNGPKNVAQGNRELFPRPEEITSNSVWLVEGEPDCVAVRSAGLPAVAVPGVATWKQGWSERFARFERVYICFDCDPEGREAASIRRDQLAGHTQAIPIDLDPAREDGYDINNLLLEQGEATSSALGSLATVMSAPGATYQPRLDREPPYEKLKRALEDRDLKVIERGPGHASTQCPNHDDRNPSLSIAEGDDGRALLHCHAGCSYEEIIAVLGFTPRDLFP